MFKRKVPLVYSLLFLLVGAAIAYIVMASKKAQSAEVASESSSSSSSQDAFKIKRLAGSKFIRPVLSAEKETESERLAGLKNNIDHLVQDLKKAGTLTTASVYVRVFREGEWMSYNPTERFGPGSLIKVPVMMAIFKQAEDDPSFLKKTVSLDTKDFVPRQTYNSEQIQPDKEYTVEELLRYMVAYSDNNATLLLNRTMSIPTVQKLFTDLGLPMPDMHDPRFTITAGEYSMFIKVLYNSSYLSQKFSEKAMALLNESDFKDGIVSGLPPNTVVVHKFGESGTPAMHQLHESAIVYLDNTAYLLTIMTKGADVKKLPPVLGQLSGLVYSAISGL